MDPNTKYLMVQIGLLVIVIPSILQNLFAVSVFLTKPFFFKNTDEYWIIKPFFITVADLNKSCSSGDDHTRPAGLWDNFQLNHELWKCHEAPHICLLGFPIAHNGLSWQIDRNWKGVVFGVIRNGQYGKLRSSNFYNALQHITVSFLTKWYT